MNTLSAVSAVIGVEGGAFALVLGWLRFGPERKATAAELWRQTAEALEKRVTALEAELHTVKAENNVLRSLVSGETAISALTALVKENHAEVIAAIRGEAGK